MLRALQFEICSKTGGIESFLLNLDDYIKKQVVCDVVCPFKDCIDKDNFERMGGRVLNVSSPRKIIKYIMQLDSIMRTGNYNLVHMNKCSAVNILPVILAYKNNIPIIVHSHNSMTRIGKIGIPLHLVNRFIMLKMADAHLACSGLAGKWMFGKRDFRLVQNGIDVEKYRFDRDKREEYRRKLNIDTNAVVFTNLGDLREQKNPIKLIDIFSEIKMPNTKLLLIGDGVMRNKVQNRVKYNCIEDRVIFLGHRKDIPDLLNCVDAVIMPSLYEGLPMSCIEAQANGIQLFLADTISPEADITGKVTWFSIKDNSDAIAKAIEESYEEQTYSDRAMDNNIVIDKGFDVKKMAETILDEYIKVAIER